MRIDLNPDGTIAAIGFMPYTHSCPDFITFDNFQQYTYSGQGDIMNADNWIVTPLPTPEEL